MPANDFTIPYAQESAAVEEAARQALILIESFAAKETNDPHGPWRQPEQIWRSLDAARTKLTDAWRVLSTKMTQEEQNANATATSTIADEDFRVVYVSMITDAFADILEDLRTNDPDFDVDVLVDCLQSGMELIAGEDREFWMNEWQGTDERREGDGLTPHARRRRDLGYDVEASST